MNHIRQTCPLCGWARSACAPQTAAAEADELVARLVGRALQWEWQVHMKDEHAPLAAAYECLTPGAFNDWVAQEGQAPAREETPPSEGVGQTVRFDLPTITPEQARNLADTIERTMISAAEGIQRFAEAMVPTLNAAQEQLVNGLRAIVEQRPGRRLGCTCNGGKGDHQPGQEGCLYRVAQAVDLTSTRILKDAAQLAPGARNPEFWRDLYGQVPVDPLAPADREVWVEPGGYSAPFGTVDAEICSNCQRLAGEPHGMPSCTELS